MGALALWLRAGCWASDNLTDGFVPKDVIPMFSVPDWPDVARELVSRGMWRPVPGGYQFHDWEDWNPTKADVERRRRVDRERQQRHRQRQSKRHDGVTTESRRSRSVTNGVTPINRQANHGISVTRESQRPGPDPYGSAAPGDARAREGAHPGPGTPEARAIAEKGIEQVRNALAERRNGKAIADGA